MQESQSTTSATAGLIDLLLRSGEALRNWRALATLVGTGLATIVVFIALGATGSAFLMFVAALLGYIMVSIGMSATGILLMDQALNAVPRSIGAALLEGTFAALRLFVLVLIGMAIALVAILAVAILVAVCKIPGLGGLLYAVVLPVSVLTLAFVYAGLYFVFSLAGAAVWSGASIRQALSALYAIVTGRLVEAALGVIVHSLLLLMVGGIIVTFIFGGVTVVVGLSAGILGSAINVQNLPMLMAGSRGSGLVYGGLFGFGILFALVGAVFFSMAILGLNRLFLHLTAHLDLAGAEAALTARMDAAKASARAMQEEARRRADEMRQRAQSAQPTASVAPAAPVAPVVVPVVPPAAVATTCPKCANPITPDDMFCGSCGHRLR